MGSGAVDARQHRIRAKLSSADAGGLDMTDIGKPDTTGGYAREFFQRLGTKYGAAEPAWTHEPRVAGQVFSEVLSEAKAQVLFGQRLVEQRGVTKEGNRIIAVRTESGDTFVGRVFIDATSERDLMAQANVAYTVGREMIEQYGESVAGVRRIVPFSKPGSAYDAQGLLPDIDPSPLGPPGRPITGSCPTFIACASPTCRPTALRSPRRKATTRGSTCCRWTGLPTIQPSPFGDIVRLNPIPNGKIDLNNRPGLITSLNLRDGGWAYPDAGYAEGDRIIAKHKTYVAGLLYFLASDPRLPPTIRVEANEWGMARDEFADTANWPHPLYVRVGRRMVGNYVMIESDAMTNTTKPDGVALGSYFLDSHAPEASRCVKERAPVEADDKAEAKTPAAPQVMPLVQAGAVKKPPAKSANAEPAAIVIDD